MWPEFKSQLYHSWLCDWSHYLTSVPPFSHLQNEDDDAPARRVVTMIEWINAVTVPQTQCGVTCCQWLPWSWEGLQEPGQRRRTCCRRRGDDKVGEGEPASPAGLSGGSWGSEDQVASKGVWLCLLTDLGPELPPVRPCSLETSRLVGSKAPAALSSIVMRAQSLNFCPHVKRFHVCF